MLAEQLDIGPSLLTNTISKITKLSTMSKASIRDRSAISVGIIGMGDMGKMYALRVSKAGWKYVPGPCWFSFIVADNL